MNSQPLAFTTSESGIPVSAPPSGVPAYRVPTATPSDILKISDAVLSTEARTFCNKVVLGFEAEFSAAKAKEWVRIYNLNKKVKLAVVDELPNALFVVLFDVDDLLAAKQALLAASPLVAGEIYASVNDISIMFDPCNQADFRHLVTVHIPRGNAIIFNIIKHIITNIGTYVKGSLGADHQHITLVAETTHKLFLAQRQFRLQNAEVSTVLFEYEGQNLRCCFCFSYRHIPAHCKIPQPRFFLVPSLNADVALGEPSKELHGAPSRYTTQSGSGTAGQRSGANQA